MSINPDYTIYKPNLKDFSRGAATSWEFNPEKKTFWLKVAKQLKDKNQAGRPIFDWKHAGLMNLAIPDLTDILCLFSGQKSYLGLTDFKAKSTQKGTGLYHQTKKGNTILKIYCHPSKDGFVLEFSSKKSDLFKAAQLISLQEAMMLLIILQEVIRQIFFKLK